MIIILSILFSCTFECSAGQFMFTNQICYDCPDGTFSSNEGAQLCEECSSISISENPKGQTSCQSCANQYANYSRTQCIGIGSLCTSIQYCNTYSSSCECMTCTSSQNYHISEQNTLCGQIQYCSIYKLDCSCQQCLNLFYYSVKQQQCNYCNIQYCLNSTPTECECKICKSHYVQVNYICCAYIEFCIVPNQFCTCNQCTTGYSLTAINDYCCYNIVNCLYYYQPLPNQTQVRQSNLNKPQNQQQQVVAECQCSRCQTGYASSYNQQLCCAIISNCSAYNPSNCQCESCSPGLYLTIDNLNCCSQISGCSSYTYSAKCICNTCMTTLYFSTDHLACCQNVNNCNALSNECRCTQCLDSTYSILYGGTKCCVTINSCQIYQQSNCYCSECTTPYQLYQQVSGKFGCSYIKNCKNYSSEGTCSACIKNFTIMTITPTSNSCCGSISECISQIASNCSCESCKSNYSLSYDNNLCCSKIQNCFQISILCNACQNCEGITNCTYQTKSKCTCEQCYKGYSVTRFQYTCCPSINQCIQLDPICSNECYECVSIQYCSNLGKNCYCNSCEGGYYLSESTYSCCNKIEHCNIYKGQCEGCYKCQSLSHCTTQELDCHCSQCEQGYQYEGNALGIHQCWKILYLDWEYQISGTQYYVGISFVTLNSLASLNVLPQINIYYMFNNKPISLVNNYYLFEYNKTIIQPFIYMKIVPKSIIKNITLTADCPQFYVEGENYFIVQFIYNTISLPSIINQKPKYCLNIDQPLQQQNSIINKLFAAISIVGILDCTNFFVQMQLIFYIKPCSVYQITASVSQMQFEYGLASWGETYLPNFEVLSFTFDFENDQMSNYTQVGIGRSIIPTIPYYLILLIIFCIILLIILKETKKFYIEELHPEEIDRNFDEWQAYEQTYKKYSTEYNKIEIAREFRYQYQGNKYIHTMNLILYQFIMCNITLLLFSIFYNFQNYSFLTAIDGIGAVFCGIISVLLILIYLFHCYFIYKWYQKASPLQYNNIDTKSIIQSIENHNFYHPALDQYNCQQEYVRMVHFLYTKCYYYWAYLETTQPSQVLYPVISNFIKFLSALILYQLYSYPLIQLSIFLAFIIINMIVRLIFNAGNNKIIKIILLLEDLLKMSILSMSINDCLNISNIYLSSTIRQSDVDNWLQYGLITSCLCMIFIGLSVIEIFCWIAIWYNDEIILKKSKKQKYDDVLRAHRNLFHQDYYLILKHDENPIPREFHHLKLTRQQLNQLNQQDHVSVREDSSY